MVVLTIVSRMPLYVNVLKFLLQVRKEIDAQILKILFENKFWTDLK